MTDTAILYLILLPFVIAFLIPLIDLIDLKYRKIMVGTGGVLEFLLSLSILIENLGELKEGSFSLSCYLGSWAPPFGITLAMDALGFFFSFLISLALLLIIIYSIGFIGHHEGKYYVLLFLVLGSMQGAIVTGDIFNLYVFIELITVSSAPLIAFKRDQEGTEAAIKYMFYNIIGGLCFFLGVILIYFNLGTLNMVDIAQHFSEIALRMRMIIISFFLLSILIKLGVFPFHFWLAKAHSACPSPISALLSGVLLKVYLYIFIRLFWVVFDFSVLQESGLASMIIYLGLFSSLVGHIFALQADDIKRMLAFSTIGHIGMILAVFALNTAAGFLGGLLHIVSHLLMKSALFTGTGYLLQFTPGHDIKELRGVGYKNRGIYNSFITAALGMIGLPPLIGFISKWYILLAFMEANDYFGLIFVLLGSFLAIVYYLRYISNGYSRTEVGKQKKDRHVLAFFYRERLVTSIIYTWTGLVVLAGVMFKFLEMPIMAAIEILINPDLYLGLFPGV
jgi:multicomponent Na+:H+ antiporter subunit D